MIENLSEMLREGQAIPHETAVLLRTIREMEGELAELHRMVVTQLTTGESHRQAALARTAFEEGFMRLRRAFMPPPSPWGVP